MSAAHLAIEYLTPGFWRWEDDAIVTLDGATLAFREEIGLLLERLEPYGAPPMEALLLLLAAIREKRPKDFLQDHEPIQALLRLPEGWESALDRVGQSLRQLPERLRKDPRAKCVLAEILFEDAPGRISPEETATARRLLETGFHPPLPGASLELSAAANRVGLAIQALLRSPKGVTAERLELRMCTGVDAPPKPIGKGKSLADEARALLAAMSGDPEWAGLARLTKNLMAAVHVPRFLAEPDDLPVGGFSDISNRGGMDRLLLSELAQEDLVLATRVALNEALYLRRESPPSSPRNARLVLVDNGLRLWGAPRLFALGVAMALAARTEAKTEFHAFGLGRSGALVPLDLLSREGLTRALELLLPSAHPGNALLELAVHHSSVERRDFILVTHPRSLREEGFLTALGQFPHRLYVATVERSGQYEFLSFHQGRRKSLHAARFSLEELLGQKESQAAPGVIDEDREPLPAIFRAKPFPILMPWSGGGSSVMHLLQGASPLRLLFSNDRRLLRPEGPNKGARQLSDGMPKGMPVVAWDRQPGSWLRWVIWTGTMAFIAECDGEEVRVLPKMLTDVMDLRHAVVHQGQLILVCRDRLRLVDLNDGSQLGELPTPGPVLLGRRDCVFADGWYRVSTNGLGPRLDPVKQAPGETPSAADESSGRKVQLIRHFHSVGVGDGGRLVLKGSDQPQAAIAYLAKHDELCFQPWPRRVKKLNLRTVKSRGFGYTLRKVSWPEGSEAWLDGRGLLHLRSGSRDLPELTLVLTKHQALAGWASTGETFGDAYFWADGPTSKASVFAEYLQRFCWRIRR